jgi:hypothetical protein
MAKSVRARRSKAAMSKTGKLSRRKGKVFEREVAAGYREIFGEQVKRGWQAREGHDAPDVENVPGLWVECKHHQHVNVHNALEQAEADSAKAMMPLAVRSIAHCKDDNKKPIVVLRQEHWFEIVAALNAGKKPVSDTPESVEQKLKLAAGVATAYAEIFKPAQPPRKNGHA